MTKTLLLCTRGSGDSFTFTGTVPDYSSHGYVGVLSRIRGPVTVHGLASRAI